MSTELRAGSRTSAGAEGRTSVRAAEALVLAGVGALLLGWFAWPFAAHGASFPVGPDGPVYLWWARLAGAAGLSAVGHRPGVPAICLISGRVLGLSVVQTTAALEIAFGVSVGLASAALVRRRTTVAGWALAGVLSGTFAVHLAAGYLANLMFAAALLAAAALLDSDIRRAGALAALVLAGGGLAHPLFFLLGALVLLVSAATAWRSDRAQAFRLGGAAFGGGIVLGIGLLALTPPPRPAAVDTSRDAFLRRAGLSAELRGSYVDRFVHRWTRYVQWVSIPLAIVGFGATPGIAGRILRSWFVLTVVGIGLALVTGLIPADRFVTFGFAVPILAALGIVRLARAFAHRRALAISVCGALVVAMLAGSAIAWNRQQPFIGADELAAVTSANAIAATLPAGVPLAFRVNEPDTTVTFTATRAGNVIRAGMPPDRIGDVVVVVPPTGGVAANPERAALERLTAADLAAAEARAGITATVFVLGPFDRVDPPEGEIAVTVGRTGTAAHEPRGPIDPLTASSPVGVIWGGVATLALFAFAGYGWARIGFADPLTAIAAAPAIGAAILTLVAVALDALGLGIGAMPGATATSALAATGGYAVWFVLQRGTRARPSPQVEQQPAE